MKRPDRKAALVALAKSVEPADAAAKTLIAALEADAGGADVTDDLVNAFELLMEAYRQAARFGTEAWKLAIDAIEELEARTSKATAVKSAKAQSLRERARLLSERMTRPEIAKAIDRHPRTVQRYLRDDSPTKRRDTPTN